MLNKILIWVLCMILVVTTVSAIDISSCISLSSGNTYDLTSDIGTFTGHCLSIPSNTIVDCHGYTVWGNTSISSRGVQVIGSNIILQNCEIINYTYGLYVNLGASSADNISLINLTTNNTNNWIYGTSLSNISIINHNNTMDNDLEFLGNGPYIDVYIEGFNGNTYLKGMRDLVVVNSNFGGDINQFISGDGTLLFDNVTFTGDVNFILEEDTFTTSVLNNSHIVNNRGNTIKVFKTIENTFFETNVGGGIASVTIEGIEKINNITSDMYITTVRVLDNAIIKDSTFLNHTAFKIYSEDDDAPHIEFTNNYFDVIEYLMDYAPSRSSFFDNTFNLYTNEQFWFSNALYENNVFLTNGIDAGLVSVTYENITINNNTFYNSSLGGIRMRFINSTISNNLAYNFTYRLIAVQDSNVYNNIGYDSGFTMYGESGVKGNNIHMYNNEFHGFVTGYPATRFGIYMTSYENSSMYNNYCWDSPRVCFATSNAKNIEIYNSVADNRNAIIQSGHGFMIRDYCENVTVYNCTAYNQSYGFLFEVNATNNVIKDSFQYDSGSIFYSLHNTHNNVAYNNYIEGKVLMYDGADNELFYDNYIDGDVEFVVGAWFDGSQGTPSDDNVFRDNIITGNILGGENTTNNKFYDNTIGGNVIIETNASILEYYTISVDGTEDTIWVMVDNLSNSFGSYDVPYNDYYLSVNHTYGNIQTIYPYTITATYGDHVEVRTFDLIGPVSYTFIFNELIPHLQGVKIAVFAGFGLIAVALLASIAFLITKMFNNGADMASLTTISIMAIGLAIVLFVGYIIISAVAEGLI